MKTVNEKVIENALKFVKDFFENEASGHDYFHTLRVYNSAVEFAQNEGANAEITALSAIFHDVDDRKLSPETFSNKENARRFLNSQNLNREEIEKIIEIIGEVSFKGTDSVKPKSLEGQCVQDADRLDAIGAVGIARAFAFDGNRNRKMYDPDIKPKINMSAREYAENDNSTTVNHFYEKLFLLKDMMNTETARTLAQERDEFMHKFLDEFYKECNF